MEGQTVLSLELPPRTEGETQDHIGVTEALDVEVVWFCFCFCEVVSKNSHHIICNGTCSQNVL